MIPVMGSKLQRWPFGGIESKQGCVASMNKM